MDAPSHFRGRSRIFRRAAATASLRSAAAAGGRLSRFENRLGRYGVATLRRGRWRPPMVGPRTAAAAYARFARAAARPYVARIVLSPPPLASLAGGGRMLCSDTGEPPGPTCGRRPGGLLGFSGAATA